MNDLLLSLGLSNQGAKIFQLLVNGTVDTLYMVVLATIVSIIVGVPLGVILLVTSKGYFWHRPVFYSVLGSIVNALRSIPFLARLVETSLRTVSYGLVEAAQSMGASPFRIIRKVLLPEALPELIQNFTLTVIVIIGCSAMAGTIGGGGLGDIAIRYGYQRFQVSVMVMTVIILIIMVQLTQILGDYLSKKVDHR